MPRYFSGDQGTIRPRQLLTFCQCSTADWLTLLPRDSCDGTRPQREIQPAHGHLGGRDNRSSYPRSCRYWSSRNRLSGCDGTRYQAYCYTGLTTAPTVTVTETVDPGGTCGNPDSGAASYPLVLRRLWTSTGRLSSANTRIKVLPFNSTARRVASSSRFMATAYMTLIRPSVRLVFMTAG